MRARATYAKRCLRRIHTSIGYSVHSSPLIHVTNTRGAQSSERRPTMPRTIYMGASPLVLALFFLMVAATIAQLTEARYYGSYRGYGGRTVVRRTTTVYRGRGIWGRGVWGRRLLQDSDDNDDGVKLDKSKGPGNPEDDECQTILEIIESLPELSQLATSLEDLPRIRTAMDQTDRNDTFFAPTNDAIDWLLAWGGFTEKAEAGLLFSRGS